MLSAASLADIWMACTGVIQVLTLLALLVQKYKYVASGHLEGVYRRDTCTHFTCFTGTKVQILTQLRQGIQLPCFGHTCACFTGTKVLALLVQKVKYS